MKKPFSLEEERNMEMEFILDTARIGRCSIPVYSGDIALAFHIRHREVKDLIEASYSQLRVVYGRKIRRMNQKRDAVCRSMNGYMLPLQAALQVLYQARLPQLRQSALLHACLCSERFVDRLN
jgi:hypothetical protein